MSSNRKSKSNRRSEWPKPVWDRSTRTLWFRGKVVKRFTGRAASQMALLDLLERLEWPERIEDALSALEGHNRKRRLHDTIAKLNQKQENPLLRFHGYAEGHGIWWEAVRKGGEAFQDVENLGYDDYSTAIVRQQRVG